VSYFTLGRPSWKRQLPVHVFTMKTFEPGAMSFGCATATGSREQRRLHGAGDAAKLSIARARLPRPTNPRHNTVAAQPCVALRVERRQVFCLDEAAGPAVRRLAGARADHIRSAGRGDHQHNSERKQGRQNAASSPSHVNPLDFEAEYLRGSLENAAFYQRRRAPARTRRGD
jgi:hypothetical protein